MVEKTMTNPFPFTQVKLRVFSLLIGVILVGGCSSTSVSSESSQIELVTTTTILNNDDLIDWLKLSSEKVALPKIAGLSRNQIIMKLSEFRYALRDFVETSRRNSDVRISTIGADWMAEIEDSISKWLDASIAQNSAASADALGRYTYLLSKEKRELVANCMIDTTSC